MTPISSTDAVFATDPEPNLSIPFKPKANQPRELDPTSIPAGFDLALADLLWKVKLAGVSLTGKIAEYAGFYLNGVSILWDATTNNGNEPDKKQLPAATAKKQPNKSLDKLTFLIMFILPYKTKTPSVYFGDPLNDKKPTTWSYLANQLRVGTLKKLNQAGEQVNKDKRHCDDDNFDLGDEYDTPTAFAYYGFQSAVAGKSGDIVQNQPLYAYLTLSTEGKFGKEDLEVRSVTQQPENIKGLMDYSSPKPVLKSRLVYSGTYILSTFVPHFPATPDDYGSQIIQREANTNRHYVVNKNNPSDKLFLELVRLHEDLSDEVFELKGLRVTPAGVSNTSWFVASYYTLPHFDRYDKTWLDNFGFVNGLTGDKQDLQFEKIMFGEHSGVTMGWGLDMGARWWPAHYYNIEFKILIYDHHATQTPAITDFRLLYRGTRVSKPITFDVSLANVPNVKAALLELLELSAKAWSNPSVTPKNPDTITVTPITKSGIVDYSTGWNITIRRVNMETQVNGFYNIYLGNIFYNAEKLDEVRSNIKIIPEMEKERFVENPDALNADGDHKAWIEFTTTMNGFFGGTNWLHASHFTGLIPGQESEEIARFEELMKRSIGVQRGAAFVLARNNRTLLKKFRFPEAPLLYPRFLTLFVIPEYYDKSYANVPSHLKNRMNVAEKYVMLTRAYQGKTVSQPLLNTAIESKSINDLITAVKSFNSTSTQAPRKDAIVKNLNDKFRKILYRNVEFD